MIRQGVIFALYQEQATREIRAEGIINLYLAWRMNEIIRERNLKLTAAINGQLSVEVNGFRVKEGRLALNFYDCTERSAGNGKLLDFENGLEIVLNNTWKSPEVVHKDLLNAGGVNEAEGAEGVREATNALKPKYSGIRAWNLMDQVDYYLTCSIYEQALGEVLNLISQANAIHREEPNHDLVEGTVIYNLEERDRIRAAWRLVQKVKDPKIDLRASRVEDIVIQHVMTGETEMGFSGRYGSEQQWIARNCRRFREGDGNHDGRQDPRNLRYEGMTPVEQSFFGFAVDFADEAVNPEQGDKQQRRHR